MARWPHGGPTDEQAEHEYDLLMDIVRGIRNVRAQYNVKPSQKIAGTVVAGPFTKAIETRRHLLAALAGLDEARFQIFDVLEDKPQPAAAVVVQALEVYLPLAGLVDLQAEQARLGKELADVERQLARSELLLAGEFAAKAPAEVVERERGKLAGLKQSQAKLAERLAALK